MDWGAWGEAGRATHLAARGLDTIATADGFATLAALLRHQRVNTGVFDYQPDALFRAFPHAVQSPLLAVAFARRVKTDLDVVLTPAEVWAHPSPAELATHIDSTLRT